MTAPVTATVIANTLAPSPTPPASDADGTTHDFSRILADQCPAADAPDNAAERDVAVNGANHADHADDIAPGPDTPDSPDNQLAALALTIATQVAELQGAARRVGQIQAGQMHATPAGAAVNASDATDAPAPGTRPLAKPHAAANLTDLAHATPGAAQTGTATDAATPDVATRLSAALPGDAPLFVPATSGPHHSRQPDHHVAHRPTRADALFSDPSATARGAAHANPHANRDTAASVLTATSAPTSADPSIQTGQPLASPVSESGAPTLPALDALPRDFTQTRADAAPVPSSPSLPAIAAPLASPHWGRELGQRLVTLTRHADGDTHSAELRLDPPELGPLRVTLTLSEGMAQAAFVSPHAHVRHSIEAALEQLQATLAQSGIELGHTSVSDQHEQNTDAFSPQPRHSIRASTHADLADDTAAPVRHHDALVDVYA